MLNQKGYTITELVIIVLGLFGTYGYFANIVKLVLFAFSDVFYLSGVFILRIVGVFIFPLGCVLGFF